METQRDGLGFWESFYLNVLHLSILLIYQSIKVKITLLGNFSYKIHIVSPRSGFTQYRLNEDNIDAKNVIFPYLTGCINGSLVTLDLSLLRR